jgi:effector protein LidA
MARSRKSPVVEQPVDSNKEQELQRLAEKTLPEPKAAVEPERTQKAEIPAPVVENKMTLDQWVDSIISRLQDKEDPERKKDYRPTVNLSRFGLKTSEDVKTFLQSPAGEAVIREMGAKLALEKAIVQEQQLQAQEHRLLMSRLKAFLFMLYLSDKADAADRARDLIIKYNELSQEKAKHAATDSPKKDTKRNEALAESIAKYEDAVRQAQENVAKGEVLQKQRDELVKEGEHLQAKYNVYDASLEEFDKSDAARIKLTPDEIKVQANQLSPEMDEHAKMIHKALEGGNARDARGLLLKAQIAQLAKQMDAQADNINDLLLAGKDDEARALLEQQNALNLKAANLHDLLAVNDKRKYYVNEQGEKTHNFHEAQFILVRGQKIVKDGQGEIYLLQPNQDWESVKNDSAAKARALQDYKDLKPQLMCVKKVVAHNKGLETAMNQDQIAETDQLIKANRAEGLLIANMISQQQAARSSAQYELDNPGPARNVSRPTPTAGNAAVPKPSQASATLFYREQIQELKLAQNITYEQLHSLADNLPRGPNQEAAKEYLKQMPRTGNIPHLQMQSMLQNMERFGIDATKPAVTKIQNPLEKANTAPTPLSMMPDPTRG